MHLACYCITVKNLAKAEGESIRHDLNGTKLTNQPLPLMVTSHPQTMKQMLRGMFLIVTLLVVFVT